MADQLGRYQLAGKIAAGGMAEVHRARVVGASGFEKEVALKLILPQFAEEKEFVEMFIDEAKIAADLSHPNIVQVLELGEANGQYFIAMELVDGENLHALLKRLKRTERRLPVPLAVHIAIEALTGLGFAHSATGRDGKRLELIHRDVSPQNIFLSRQGHVKVGDFGIAKAAGRVTQTQGGVVKGKFRYMSPEQLANKPLDSRSDLFAMGAVLYEMVAGEPLFNGTEQIALMEQVRKAEFRPFPAGVKVPPALEAILKKSIQRRPPERYGSAEEFAKALRGFLMEARYSIDASDLRAYLADGTVPSPTPATDRTSRPPVPAHDSEPPIVQGALAESMELLPAGAQFDSQPSWNTGSRTSSSSYIRVVPVPERRRSLPLLLAGLALACGLGVLGWGYHQGRLGSWEHHTEPPLPPGMGALTVKTRPEGLTVQVDGVVYGTTPLVRTPVFPGRHKMTITSPRKGQRRLEFQVFAGRETLFSEDF